MLLDVLERFKHVHNSYQNHSVSSIILIVLLTDEGKNRQVVEQKYFMKGWLIHLVMTS